jgi:hypothetical protein
MACNLFFREIPIVTRYFPEASSINFRRSLVYGLGILRVLVRYILHQRDIIHCGRLEPQILPESLNEKNPGLQPASPETGV